MKKTNRKKIIAIGATGILLIAAITGCSSPLNGNVIEKIDHVDEVIEEHIDAGEDKIEAAIEGKIEAVTAQTVKAEEPLKSVISKDQAEEIALKHAGVSDVTWVKAELDDGKYEVDFEKDGYEYDYDIDPKSGKVIRSEKERDDDDRASVKKETAKQEPVKEEVPKTELIGKDKAKSIALKHAGVSGADRVKVELDDGKYEVDFKKDGYEYDYEVGAKSGKIIKSEKERDDD